MTYRISRRAPALALVAAAMTFLLPGCGKEQSIAPRPVPDVEAQGWYMGDTADQPNGYWFPRSNFIGVADGGSQQRYYLVGPQADALDALFQAGGGTSVSARIEGVDTGNRPTSMIDGSESIEVTLIAYELLTP